MARLLLETKGYPEMKIDEDKIDEAALALLWLARFKTSKHFDVWSSWKSIEWDVMNRLHDAGMISNPVGKAKSITFTLEGRERAEELFQKLFCVDEEEE